jgi:hypothetical protein
LAGRIEELLRSPCELLPLGVHPLEAAAGATVEQLIARLDKSLADSQMSIDSLGKHFQGYAKELAKRGLLVDQLLQSKTQTPDELFQQLVRGVFSADYECGKTRVLSIDVVEDITRELVELQLLQAIARTEVVDLEEIDIRADQALEVARRYRRDWMNRRAQLVDLWRRLQFNANQLQAGLDVFFNGSISNIGDNPFHLRTDTGALQAGVRFDAPITRMAERNTYRQSLIEYQQARRNFYNFEDSVAQQIRAQLRAIISFQINFELNRMGVLEAAKQIMINTYLDVENQRTATTRATVARDQLQALGDLLNAQNAFMLIYISYEVSRLQLDFNLGTMQLDSDGLWIDPGRVGQDYGQYDPWLWRNSPGSIGQQPGADDDSMQNQDKAIDQLPPPFLLPSGDRESLPPSGAESVPQPPRAPRER